MDWFFGTAISLHCKAHTIILLIGESTCVWLTSPVARLACYRHNNSRQYNDDCWGKSVRRSGGVTGASQVFVAACSILEASLWGHESLSEQPQHTLYCHSRRVQAQGKNGRHTKHQQRAPASYYCWINYSGAIPGFRIWVRSCGALNRAQAVKNWCSGLEWVSDDNSRSHSLAIARWRHNCMLTSTCCCSSSTRKYWLWTCHEWRRQSLFSWWTTQALVGDGAPVQASAGIQK